MWRIREFFSRIKNVLRWLPVIWRDRDWDDYFIWEILKFKLKNQAKHIGDRDRHTRAKHDAKVMNLCVRLIDKIEEEFYQMEYMDYADNLFSSRPSETHPGYFELDIEERSERYDEYFKKYPRIYKKVVEAEWMPFNRDSKAGIAMNIAHINEKRVQTLLFKILDQNIRAWWD